MSTSSRPWLVLAVLCLPVLLVSMDVSILFFAAPHIAQSLRPTPAEQLWIFDMYGFVLAGFLLTMGAVADRYGRRRVLLIGAVGFGVASAMAACAPTAGWLIAARALLGLGGATLMPSTLAIIRDAFYDDASRARAVGIWAAVLAGGTGIGPVVAGLLLDRFSWGSVFLINLPVVVVLLVVGPYLLPESRNRGVRVDLAGSVLSLVAVLSLVQAVKDVAAHGWTPDLLALVLIAAVAAYGFVRRQRTAAMPMVDPALFTRPGFGGAIATQLIAMALMLGNAVMITQYLQSVLGLTALAAALWSLAPTLLVGVAAPAAATIAHRVGTPVVVGASLTLSATGYLLYLLLTPSSPIWLVLLAATPISMGVVSVSTIVTDHAISLAPTDRAAGVAAITETASELGGALGMAILGSILAAA